MASIRAACRSHGFGVRSSGSCTPPFDLSPTRAVADARKALPLFRLSRGVTRGWLAFHSFRKCFVRALELAGVDRDRAALVVGH